MIKLPLTKLNYNIELKEIKETERKTAFINNRVEETNV